jgi:type VI protein secretion system component Hcp
VSHDLETGAVDDTTVAGWDIELNQAWDGSNPGADAIGDKLLPSVEAGTPLDYYIRFDGVGDSEWLVLDNFSLGFAQEASLGGAGGIGGGQATAEDVSSLLGSSATSTLLAQLAYSGKFLPEVEIEVYRPGGEGKDQLVDEFKFSEVVITGVDTDAGSGFIGNDVRFDFTKFSHGHIDYDPVTDKAQPADTVGFDFETSQAGGGDTPNADALGEIPQAQEFGGNLEYYVRFDGVGDHGWLRLESFSLGVDAPWSAITPEGGGGSSGLVSPEQVSLGLGSSGSLVALTEALLEGKHLSKVEVEVYRPGGEGKDQLVDEFVFEEVLLRSLDTSNATSNLLGLDFTRFSQAHVSHDLETGAVDDTTVAGWDIELNQAWDGPSPHADVLF